jgi:hypothetical protein
MKIFIEVHSVNQGELEEFTVLGNFTKDGEIESGSIRAGTEFKCNLEDDISKWIKHKKIDPSNLLLTYHFDYYHGFKYCKLGSIQEECNECESHGLCGSIKDGLYLIETISIREDQIPYSRGTLISLLNSLKWNIDELKTEELTAMLSQLGFFSQDQIITIPNRFMKGYLRYTEYGGLGF